MKEDHISRPEFDRYVKMTAEAMATIAKSTQETAKESRESNQILREYIITNNHKHDAADKRMTAQAKEMGKIKAAVEANSRVTSFALLIKKAGVVVGLGALTALGAIMTKNYWG